MTIPIATVVEADAKYRLLAVRVPSNAASLPRLLILALPNASCQRSEVCGELQVAWKRTRTTGDLIEWVFVKPAHRRRGLARRMWRAAEKVLRRKLDGDPAS